LSIPRRLNECARSRAWREPLQAFLLRTDTCCAQPLWIIRGTKLVRSHDPTWLPGGHAGRHELLTTDVQRFFPTGVAELDSISPCACAAFPCAKVWAGDAVISRVRSPAPSPPLSRAAIMADLGGV
jgi:hypothetical protein